MSRRVFEVVLAFTTLELLLVIVTGAPVSRGAFALRLALLAALTLWRFTGATRVLLLLLLPHAARTAVSTTARSATSPVRLIRPFTSYQQAVNRELVAFLKGL